MFGIGTEIHHDLVHLGAVGQAAADIASELLANLNGFGERGAEETKHLLDKRRIGFRLPLCRLLPTEGQDLLNQFFRPHARHMDHLEILPRGALGRHFSLCEFGITHHRGQDIIELMGNAAG